MKKIIKYLTLFLVGGVFYYSLEVIFRGYSFPAMAVCGGLCFIICGVINERSRCMPLVLQQLIAASGITVIEFIFGLILNVWLGLNMWDYSNMPGNVLGQICPQFMILWFFLSAVGIILDDVVRWRFFGEEKEKNREELQYMMLKALDGSLCLSEATAKAMQRIPDAKCNGDMHAALDYELEQKHDLENFLTRQGVNHITGE